MTDQEFEDLRQTYGELYSFSDHKRGEHVRYRAYTGELRSGEIVWIQVPGAAVGRDGQRRNFRAQYVIMADAAYETSMPDFVNLGDIQG